MKLTLSDILIFFQYGCMIASALFSIRLINNRNKPKYMDHFYWYSIIGGFAALLVLLCEYFNVRSSLVMSIVDRILIVFHFVFLNFFIFRRLPNKKYARHILLLLAFCLLIIITYLIKIDPHFPPAISITLSNLSLVLLACVYYSQIFNQKPSITLSKEPAFWIITGIFIGMCATIPFSLFGNYILIHVPYDQYLLVGGVNSVGYGLMHLFFIKGYLCATKKIKNL